MFYFKEDSKYTDMMNYRLKLFGALILGFYLLISGCEDDLRQEKYQRPDWLAGKLYTGITNLAGTQS